MTDQSNAILTQNVKHIILIVPSSDGISSETQGNHVVSKIGPPCNASYSCIMHPVRLEPPTFYHISLEFLFIYPMVTL